MSARFAELPTIITAPGMYRTRGGRSIQIHEIRAGSTFQAKGTWRKGVRSPRKYDVWHQSGRYLPSAESQHDIVGPLDADNQ